MNGSIYKITNKINGKIYIGKTIRTPYERWQEHVRESLLDVDSEIPLHKAIRKYGKENFTIEVVETNISTLEELNQKEKQYIKIFDSKVHHHGYNVADGGDGGRIVTKITIEQVKQIKEMLSDQENLESFSEIGKRFGLTPSSIREINIGNSWYDEKDSYPIRKYNVAGLTIPKKEYEKIVNELKASTLSISEIQSKYDLSQSQINAINNGHYCYDGTNDYYKDIYRGPFPIRFVKRKDLTQQQFIPIFYDILFTTESMEKIGKKYGIKGNTITYISYGKRHKNWTQDYLIPLRKNLEINQTIFLNKYPNYKNKGGDK